MTSRTGVVWVAGVDWHGLAGTEKQLVRALVDDADVHWIDPPVSVHRLRGRPRPAAVDGLTVRTVVTPPGVTRWPSRAVVRWQLDRAVTRAVARTRAAAVVVAHPLARFPAAVRARRVLYVTDDWVAGAGLMGLNASRVERILRANARAADAVVVVSPHLAEMLEEMVGGRAPIVVVPNGTSAPESTEPAGPPLDHPTAVLAGQINERTDLALLEAVADAGLRLELIGPRVHRDPAFARRLDALIDRSEVSWTPQVSQREVRERLQRAQVGLTPYTDTPFNRASSPLKTYEYLAAGLPVVSSDLPASRWLATPLVAVAREPVEFARAALAAATDDRDDRADVRARCRALAAAHGWDRRARRLLEVLSPGGEDVPVPAAATSDRQGEPAVGGGSS